MAIERLLTSNHISQQLDIQQFLSFRGSRRAFVGQGVKSASVPISAYWYWRFFFMKYMIKTELAGDREAMEKEIKPAGKEPLDLGQWRTFQQGLSDLLG